MPTLLETVRDVRANPAKYADAFKRAEEPAVAEQPSRGTNLSDLPDREEFYRLYGRPPVGAPGTRLTELPAFQEWYAQNADWIGAPRNTTATGVAIEAANNAARARALQARAANRPLDAEMMRSLQETNAYARSPRGTRFILDNDMPVDLVVMMSGQLSQESDWRTTCVLCGATGLGEGTRMYRTQSEIETNVMNTDRTRIANCVICIPCYRRRGPLGRRIAQVGEASRTVTIEGENTLSDGEPVAYLPRTCTCGFTSMFTGEMNAHLQTCLQYDNAVNGRPVAGAGPAEDDIPF